MNKSIAAALAGVLTAAAVASAQVNIERNAANYPLNSVGAWIGGVVPGGTNIAVWDVNAGSTYLSEPLSGSMTWGGILISNNVEGPVTIPLDTFTLSLSNGINMWQAPYGLTLNNTNTSVVAPQEWQIGNGQTLTVNGALEVWGGAMIRFNFDGNPSSQAVITPNTYTGSMVTVGNTLLGTPEANAVLTSPTSGLGTGPTILYATSNDVDFAALNGANEVVGGASLGWYPTSGAFYVTNNNGSTPSIGSSSTYPLVWDVVNTNSAGIAIRGNYAVSAIRFNTPQTNTSGANVYTYNGVPSWSIAVKTGSLLSLNAILMTTNLGSSAVVVTASAGSELRIDGISSSYATPATPNEFLVIQNNPASSFVVQSYIGEQRAGSLLSKIGVGTMEMQGGGNWTGGTAIYGGTLLIDGAGMVGSSALTVYNGGNFEGEPGATNTAPVTVNSGGTNSVYVVAANNEQFTNNATLTYNAGTPTLQFLFANGISPSTTVAPLLLTSAVTANGGAGAVNLNVVCGSLSASTSYPLIQYNASYPVSASAFTLAVPPHINASLGTGSAPNTIYLNVTTLDQPMHWAAGSGTWDINDSANTVWKDSGGNLEYYEQLGPLGDNVVFSDTDSGTSPITVTLNSIVLPSSVTNNSTKNYTISGSGSINGTGSFTKLGTSTLNLWTTNSFSGGLNIDAGIVNFQDPVQNLGSGTITFNGGTLQFNAAGNTADISSLPTVFASGGATIDTDGNNVSFANAVGGGGAGGLTKVGAGTLTLGGANTYSGATTISAGTLALGVGASLPDSSITVGSAGTFNVSALTSFTLGSGQTLSGTGTVLGTISAGSGTVIAATSPLSIANLTVGTGGTVELSITQNNSDLISVPGTLTLTAGTGAIDVNISGALPNGTYPLITFGTLVGSVGYLSPSYSGLPAGHQATISASATQINLVVSSLPNVLLEWAGTSSTWDTGATSDWLLNGTPGDYSIFATGDTVEFNDVGIANTTVTLTGAIQPNEVIVSVTNASYTFTGSGNLTGPAALVYSSHGSGTLQVDTGNNNTGGASIGASSTLQVGNGSATGCYLGPSGNITNLGSLIFDQPDSQPALTGTISGSSGSLTQEGGGTLILAANNTYGGGTTISSGTLQIGNGGATGSVTGAILDNATLAFDNGAALTAGNAITGSGAVTCGGSGVLTLSGNNSYYGNTTVTAGTVKVGSATAIPNINANANATGVLNVNGGKFDLNGNNVTINALSGTTGTPLPLVTNSGSSGTQTLTLVNTSASTTYSGQIAENPTGAKLALATYESSFTLDGPATLTGGITVEPNAGLDITGNGAAYTGPITMDNSTTLYLPINGEGIANNITIASGATASFSADAQQDYFSGQFIGASTSIMQVTSDISVNAAAPQWASFPGTVYIPLSGSIRFGTGGAAITNGGSSTTWNLAGGELTCREGSTVELGALEGASTELAVGIDGPTVAGEGTYIIGYLGGNTVYANPFIGNNNLIKVGSGTLTLNGTVSYAGNTTVSNTGTLAINGSASLDYSTNIAVLTGSTLDFSTFAAYAPNDTLTLGNLSAQVQTLSGSGTVKGAIVALANYSIIAPGDSATVTGNLTATGAVTIAGTVRMNLDTTNALTSDLITAPSFTIQPGATLTVSNIGPAITAPQTFTLFSQPVSAAFTTVTLPALGCGSLSWVNTLTSNGKISVVGTPCVNTTPTNITFSVSGIRPNQSLTLSWPANQIGWTLQAQTNAAGGINPNAWVNVAGSTSVDTITIPIVPGDADVFYRLMYTIP
jgi:autotransporter-associated beta strand protein